MWEHRCKIAVSGVGFSKASRSADIPLAADVIGRGGHALDPRGVLYTADNIQERLTMRNFMDGLRASGIDTGGPAPWRQGDSHAFARHLDRILSAPESPSPTA